MSEFEFVINQIREVLIEKYNLNEGDTTTTLLSKAISIDKDFEPIFLRIVYLLNKPMLEDYELNSLKKLFNVIK